MGERENKISLYQYSEKWLMFKIKGPNHLTNNVIWKHKSYLAADSNSYDLEQPETQRQQGSALIQNTTREGCNSRSLKAAKTTLSPSQHRN